MIDSLINHINNRRENIGTYENGWVNGDSGIERVRFREFGIRLLVCFNCNSIHHVFFLFETIKLYLIVFVTLMLTIISRKNEIGGFVLR